MGNVKHVLVVIIQMPSFVKYLLKSFPLFIIELWVLYNSKYKSFVKYMISIFSMTCLNYFLSDLSLHFLNGILWRAKVLNFKFFFMYFAAL